MMVVAMSSMFKSLVWGGIGERALVLHLCLLAIG